MSHNYSLQLGPATWFAMTCSAGPGKVLVFGTLTIREQVTATDPETGERVAREEVRHLHKGCEGATSKEAWANLSAWVGEVLR